MSELLKLNPNEAKKWVQNYDDKPESGKKYAIPNTVVTFTSKSTKWVSDGVLSFANEVRRIIKSDAKKYEKDGFHVIRHFQSDDSGEFVDEWGADGIYMYLFAGHGAYKDGKYYGFIIGDGQVTPDMIKSLKYKLARVKALTCGSALVQYNATAFDSNGNLVQSYWKSLVSSNGSFSGFDDWVNWVNGIDHFVTSPGSP